MPRKRKPKAIHGRPLEAKTLKGGIHDDQIETSKKRRKKDKIEVHDRLMD